MNKLVLIDGNAIMHRAYHALPPLTSPDGKPAHVIYGFISMIIKIYGNLHPTHLAVCFDRPGPTFREKLFEKYQAQRPKMEDDFVSQIPKVHDVVTAFGIPIYEQDGFEADDVIGTITKQCQVLHDVYQIIIVTGDRDILQLVDDERVLVFMPTKGLSEGKLYGENDVIERMGVKPALIPDYKALAGDASDNYPGVVGIGPKTAIKLLEKYKTIQRILPTLSEADRESAKVSHELATIRCDAPIEFDEISARVETLDTPRVREKLVEFHFPSLLKRLVNGEAGKGAKSKNKIKKNSEVTQPQLF